MADGVTIPIKGDISKLNSEIEKAKKMIDSTNVELYKNEKKLYEVKKQRVEQDTRYINVLSNYKKQLSDGIISEEQYANKLKKLNEIRKESQKNIILEEKQIRNVIASNKQRIAVQEKLISVEAIYSRTQKEAQATNKITLEQLKKQIIEEKNLENIKSKRTATSIQKSSFSKEALGEMKKYYGEREKYEKDFVNSSAQNKYNEAIARLNDLQTRGIITTKEKEKALQSQKKILDENTNSTSNLANQTIRYLRWAGTIAGVVYAANRAWDMTLGKGIEVNKIIESNTYGIAALVSANTQMIDTYGNALTPLQKFTMGQEHAKIAIEQIRKESIKTAATFPQLLEIYQQGIGKTLSMGDAFGSSTKQIEQNTIKLASRMSNFANAIGMNMDRVREEMRSLVSGNASTDSLISTIIFGSPGEANKAVREAEKRTNGLAELLDIKFKPFDILADTKTFEKSILTLQDSWQRAMGDMVKKSGMFKDITNAFYDMSKEISENTDGIVAKFDSFYNTTKSVVSALDEIVIAATAIYASRKALSAISFVMADIDIKTKGSTSSMKLFGASIWALTKANAPLLAISSAIAAIAYNDNKMEQYADNMSDKYRDMYESRVKESKTQEENLKLIREYSNILGITYDRLTTSKNLSDSEKTIAEQQVKVLTEQLDILGRRSDLSNEELKKVDELFKVNKSLGELQAGFAVNAELLKKTQEETFKEEGKIVELQKEKAEISKELLKNAENQKKLQEQLKNQKEDKNSEQYIANLKANAIAMEELKTQEKTWKEGILTKDKQIAEVRQKQWEKDIAQTEARTKKIQKQNEEQAKSKAIELEIAALMSNTYDSETYKTDMTKLRVETLIEEYKALNEGITKQETLRDILKAQLEYEKAITDQNNKQNSFKNIKTYIDTNGLDMDSLNQLEEGLRITFAEDSESLNAIDKFIEQAKKKLYKEDFALEIKFTGFDDISNGLAQIGNSFQDMQKEALKYNEILKDKDASPLKKKQAQLDYADATISGYANMIGALGNFYDEDDSRRKKQQEIQKVFFAAKMAMQIADLMQTTTIEGTKQTLYGTTALANALTAPFPANIPAYTMVAGMLASLGIAFGGKAKESISSDAFSAKAENLGKGSVLGDTDAASESIKNSLNILEDYAQPQFQVLSEMNKSLKTLNQQIGGMSGLLIRQGGFAFGEGAVEFDTGFKNNVSLGGNSGTIGMVGGAGLAAGLGYMPGLAGGSIAGTALAGTGWGLGLMALDKLLLGGALTDFVGGAINSVLGSVFGKTSTSQSLTDYGINFNDTLMQEAIKQIEGQSFQTITTVMTKKSLFSKSSSTSINTYFEELDNEIERQFSLVLSNLYDATVISGQALDANVESVKNSLNSFNVEIGKISTKGKTGEEIQEQISNIFGKIGDDIAKRAFPELESFQQIGEGLFETMTRVGTGMEIAEYYIKRLGYAFEDIKYTEIENKQGDVALEALTQSIVKLDEAVYGTNNGVVQMIESFSGTAEELYSAYTTFEQLRMQLESVNKSANGLTSSMILGAGSISELQGGIDDYFENFLSAEEILSSQTILISKEFEKLNLIMPRGKEGFKDLINSIDMTTESGQELYGRLIILSKGFAEFTDSIKQALDAEVYNAMEMEKLYQTLRDEQKENARVAIDSIKTLSDAFATMSNSIEDTIAKLLGSSGSEDAQQQLIKQYWIKRNEIDELLEKQGDLKTSEQKRLQDLVSDVQGLSTNIQSATIGDNSKITNELVSELTGLKNVIRTQDEILKTQIVDANGKVIGVAEEKGVLTLLKESIDKYNKNIEASLQVDTTPLSIEDFKEGGLLKTPDEIAFRQSFQAESAKSFNQELESLRTSLSYLSLETTNAGGYLQSLADADSTTFKNIGEFFEKVGVNNTDYNKVTADIAEAERLAQKQIYLQDMTDLIEKSFGDSNKLQEIGDFASYFTDWGLVSEANKLKNSKLLNKILEDGEMDFWNDFSKIAVADAIFENYDKQYEQAKSLGQTARMEDINKRSSKEEKKHGITKDQINILKDIFNIGDTIYGMDDYYKMLNLDYMMNIGEENKEELIKKLDSLFDKKEIYKEIDGSHANGLASVPYDGYIAELHKNERVLTASESKQYNSLTSSDNTGIIMAINKQTEATRKLEKRLESIELLNKDIRDNTEGIAIGA